MKPFFCVLIFISIGLQSCMASTALPLWPFPTAVSDLNGCSGDNADTITWISSNFSFTGYDGADLEPFLRQAAARYETLILSGDSTAAVVSDTDEEAQLFSCTIDVQQQEPPPDEEAAGADESYSLTITASTAPTCAITAVTAWGALRAMETFAQLLLRSDGARSRLFCAEVQLEDAPAYPHRGLLIDSARHYLPVDTIRRVIDTLPYSKMNVLHWHIVDAQSFPLDCPSEPLMSAAAFQPGLIYTQEDLQSLAAYARDRGVQLLLELDVPGHAASWTRSHPELMARCFEKYYYNINDFALNPGLDGTYDTLRNILSDSVASLMGAAAAEGGGSLQAVHLGGDEVVYGCWAEDDSITEFMAQNGIDSYDQLLAYFVQRADAILLEELNVSSVLHWNEVFSAGYKGDPERTVFQVWTDNAQIDAITASGYRTVASPHAYWYLDVAANTWQVMYDYDPAANLTNPAEQRLLVLGGEVALWGETVDETNIEQLIYPRACAAAEVLWGKPPQQRRQLGDASGGAGADDSEALDRLIAHRCRLLNRGVRSAPVQPGGYCHFEFV